MLLLYNLLEVKNMDPKTKNDFGIRIKERRETLGISQAELARRVGYTSRSMITKIEKCESDVARDKLLALADILHTSPLYLLGLTDDPAPASSLPQNAFPLTPYGKLPIDGGIAAGNPVELQFGDLLYSSLSVGHGLELKGCIPLVPAQEIEGASVRCIL